MMAEECVEELRRAAYIASGALVSGRIPALDSARDSSDFPCAAVRDSLQSDSWIGYASAGPSW